MPQNFGVKIETPPINIDSALGLIQALEEKVTNKEALSKYDEGEIGYMISSLQDLQNDGFTEPALQTALTKLINLRDTLKGSETIH